eukprot:4916866-Amphidinium_carterae.5
MNLEGGQCRMLSDSNPEVPRLTVSGRQEFLPSYVEAQQHEHICISFIAHDPTTWLREWDISF